MADTSFVKVSKGKWSELFTQVDGEVTVFQPAHRNTGAVYRVAAAGLPDDADTAGLELEAGALSLEIKGAARVVVRPFNDDGFMTFVVQTF